MGPTAAGKTDLALTLVDKFGLEIVSVDSAQVYVGLQIGTAKPSAAVLRHAPHRLIDVRQPWQSYSAGDFSLDARTAMQAIVAAGKVPLLVGGTGLYFRALFDGLAKLPKAEPAIRARISETAASLGWTAMHRRLQAIDPDSARRIHVNDPQRIQRALEVYEITGRPISALQASAELPPLSGRHLKFVIAPADRSLLHERIAMRFDRMLAAGLVDEVCRMRADPRIHRDHPAMRAVGYRQIWEYLDGEYDYQAMRARAVAATRQLAKRQLTWFRRERDVIWMDPTVRADTEALPVTVAKFLRLPLC